MHVDFRKQGISFHVNVKSHSLELTADTRLIEQMLIILLLNAQRAVQRRKNTEVNLEARLGPEMSKN
jgi:nitrogen fixation/metabolism regulation signal transduction histidine kinase